MTIKFLRSMSDLHLEFGTLDIPQLETDKESILLLCGDIHVGSKIFNNEWLKNLSERFAYVVYLLGNHEHYKSSVDVTGIKIKELILANGMSNVILLEDAAFNIPGTNYRIFGGTMWTDMNKGDPVTQFNASRTMYDYKSIRTDNYRKKLTPGFTIAKHIDFKNTLLNDLKNNLNKNYIIATHHAPHQMSGASQYVDDFHSNGAYSSDLSELILDHSNIKYWFHGHMHNSVNYMIGDCNIINNPRGYYGEELNNDFDPNFLVVL